MKNLDRVQGDERDAIVLPTGYGEQTDGRMRPAKPDLTADSNTFDLQLSR